MALDTETSHNHDDENPLGWIYQWAFKFGEKDLVIGRRPSELINALKAIKEDLEISASKKLVIYVHNLSYDITYLHKWLTDAFGKSKILAVKPHKFITFEVGGFLFKCSYKLSNKRLSTWSEDLGTVHRKIEEEKAYYDEIHYQDEELSPENWAYQIEDVETLYESIEKQNAAYGDTILTTPLTSTGYVRRDAKRNYKKDRRNRKRFLMTRLTPESYEACRGEFAGGLVHGDRFKAGKTIRPEKGEFIRHRDFRSHYPSQQRCRKFPIGKFVRYGEHLDVPKLRELMEKYCVLLKVTFDGVKLKEGEIFPIISASKAFKNRLEKLDIVEDNGRVLDLKGKFTLWLTELDFDVILRQYDLTGGYDISEAWISRKGFMPLYMRQTVDDYFLAKTKWKELVKEEKEKENPDREKLIYLNLELMKSKNGLNGIYGMSATDIVRITYEMSETGEWSEKVPDIGEALEKYYNSENSFNRYQLGIYTTSWARHELLSYADIIKAHGGKPLYVDTDSIFYISNESVEKAIEAENARRQAHAEKIGAYIDYKGKRVYYDSFDDEGENITAFRFLHAKCYAYETTDKKGKTELHCTIAGVTEFEDAKHEFSRVDELGSIDELKKGKTFVRCGGTKSHYVEMDCTKVKINGHETEVAGACIITPTTKTLKNELEIYDDPLEWEVVS